MELGEHVGSWIDAKELQHISQMLGSDGLRLVHPIDLKEGTHLFIEGFWFEIFLYDSPHHRCFLEKVA